MKSYKRPYVSYLGFLLPLSKVRAMFLYLDYRIIFKIDSSKHGNFHLFSTPSCAYKYTKPVIIELLFIKVDREKWRKTTLVAQVVCFRCLNSRQTGNYSANSIPPPQHWTGGATCFASLH